MQFEYQKRLGPHGEAIWVAMIPVLFRKPGGGTLGAYGLVDSGASRSFFDAEYAAGLGIDDLESGESEDFTGITGHSIRGYRHTITMVVGGIPIEIGMYFCPEFHADVFNGILGQEDFFDLCPIKFTRRKRKIELMTAGEDSRIAP